MTHELQLRADATTATQKRFEGKPFDWSKAATCVHLMRFHAQQMGHKLPMVPRFRSPLTARRALKETGFNDLPGLLDSMFPRIPPAFMRTGDIMAVQGDAGFHSIFIRGSATKFLGWHVDAVGCTILESDLSVAIGAWRL
jgi:hypothetical protein